LKSQIFGDFQKSQFSLICNKFEKIIKFIEILIFQKLEKFKLYIVVTGCRGNVGHDRENKEELGGEASKDDKKSKKSKVLLNWCSLSLFCSSIPPSHNYLKKHLEISKYK